MITDCKEVSEDGEPVIIPVIGLNDNPDGKEPLSRVKEEAVMVEGGVIVYEISIARLKGESEYMKVLIACSHDK